MKKAYIILIYIVFQSFLSFGQDWKPFYDISIRFRFDNSDLDSCYMDNSKALKHMTMLLDSFTPNDIDSILLSSSFSPEGTDLHNRRLANRRTATLTAYLNKSKIISDNKPRHSLG